MPTRPNVPRAEEHLPDPDSDRSPVEQSVLATVLAAFGCVPEVLRVVVRPLWPNHFRVNVFVGPDAASASIAHSFFVEVGEAGRILSTNPRLPADPHAPSRRGEGRG